MKLELIERRPESKSFSTPLLFVHGMWHGAWCWEENFLTYFAEKGFHVFALSLRGHGNSEGRENLRWSSIKNFVDDVHQIVQQIGEPPILVGHSMGGFVVQKYLERYPCPAAVLLASVPPSGALAATLKVLRKHPLAFLKTNLTLSMYPIISAIERSREFFFSADMPEQAVLNYHSQMQNDAYRAYLDMVVFSLPKTSKINTKMLVLGGEADSLFSPREIRNTAKTYSAESEIFNGMAHDMMLEKEWQKVADHIIGWL